jgi:hypothetical protein
VNKPYTQQKKKKKTLTIKICIAIIYSLSTSLSLSISTSTTTPCPLYKKHAHLPRTQTHIHRTNKQPENETSCPNTTTQQRKKSSLREAIGIEVFTPLCTEKEGEKKTRPSILSFPRRTRQREGERDRDEASIRRLKSDKLGIKTTRKVKSKKRKAPGICRKPEQRSACSRIEGIDRSGRERDGEMRRRGNGSKGLYFEPGGSLTLLESHANPSKIPSPVVAQLGSTFHTWSLAILSNCRRSETSFGRMAVSY